MAIKKINYTGNNKVIKRLCEIINQLGSVATLDYGSDTTKYLRNDGTWQTVEGGGIPYGECNTMYGQTAVEVNVPGFVLQTGSTVAIKFKYMLYRNATLNINDTGAYPIYADGKAISISTIYNNSTAIFIFTGTRYDIITTDKKYIISGRTADTLVGNYSTAEGYETIATGSIQHVGGRYNLGITGVAEIIGNGTSDSARSNARTLDWSGNETIAGDLKAYNGTSTVTRRKNLTISGATSDTSHTGYTYAQTFTWTGCTANHRPDICISSGTYNGDLAVETLANQVKIYFSEQPSSSLVVTVMIDDTYSA